MPTLRILHGAGASYDLPAEVASRYSGNAEAALRQLVADHISDPELLATLNHPRVALEEFYQDADDVHEAPLSPHADWSEIVTRLEQTDVELGVAHSHIGGL